MYCTLRGNQACSIMQCLRLGVSGPEGKNYCPTHMSQAVLPTKETPKVKFEDTSDRPEGYPPGMGSIPDGVLLALVSKMQSVEGLSEPEIASMLADDYGGELLENALRIYKLSGDRSSSSHQTDASGCPDLGRGSNDRGHKVMGRGKMFPRIDALHTC